SGRAERLPGVLPASAAFRRTHRKGGPASMSRTTHVDGSPPRPAADPPGPPLDVAPHLEGLLQRVQAERREAEECQSQAAERAALRRQARGRLERASEAVCSFPAEENRAGNRPSKEGFRRWAGRLIALAEALKACGPPSGAAGPHARLSRAAR